MEVVPDTLQCQTHYSARHTTLPDTIQCQTHYRAKHTTVPDTIQSHAQYRAKYTTVPVTLQCQTHYRPRHTTVLDTIQCQTHYSARHTTEPDTWMLLQVLYYAISFNDIGQFGRRMVHTMIHMNKWVIFASCHRVKYSLYEITWRGLGFVDVLNSQTYCLLHKTRCFYGLLNR